MYSKRRTILPSLTPHQVTPQLPSQRRTRLPLLTPKVTPQLPSQRRTRLPSLTPELHLHLPKVTPQLPSRQRKTKLQQLRTRLPSLTSALHLHLQRRSRLEKVHKTMSKKLSFNSSKSSKSSDSTRKRYDRHFAKVIKKLPIGDAYEHVFTHFQNLREVPDKYRYPLRDDTKYKYVLRNEIPKDKLKNSLCGNPSPGVFELLFDMKFRIDWSLLVKHPDAFTKKYQLENIIKGQQSTLFWYNLFMNTNPRVIKFVNKIMEDEKNKDKKRNYYNILANNPTPEAIKIVKQVLQNFKGNRKELLNSLADNPTPEAMELLKRIAKQTDFENNQTMWIRLLANPAAMEFIENCLWISINKYWYIMYKNPNPKAFKLIEKFSGHKFDKNYNYDHLSENHSSKAIKILQERMNQEKSISKEDYYDLIKRNSVSIFLNWIKISKNPRAKSLILAKIEEEKGREKEIAEDRKNGYPERNLDWGYLSANPAIFKRIRKLTEEKAKDEEKAIKIERYIHPLQ